MENKINIAELLKNCPRGMELDCTLYYNVFFDRICEDDDCLYPIKCYTIEDGIRNSVDFTEFGEFHTIIKSKCVIFPKGKTTWKGFVPPCKFKDGDIIYTKHKLGYEFVSIFRVEYERDICTYWDMNLSANKLIGYLHDGKAFKVFIEKDKVKEQRFATEEEKQKLFKTFKDNGYTWNTETKTLDKLPKFKVGDRIKLNNCSSIYTITDLLEDKYRATIHSYDLYEIKFERQDAYELVPNKFDINTLVPFESRVLVRDSNIDEWGVSFWGCLRDNRYGYNYDTSRGYYKQCIPYENNEYLLGKTEDCKDFYKTWE